MLFFFIMSYINIAVKRFVYYDRHGFQVNLTRTMRERIRDRHRHMDRKACTRWAMHSDRDTPAGAQNLSLFYTFELRKRLYYI